MSIKRRVVLGTVWSAAEGWALQVLSLVIFMILADLLGPETFGLLGMAMIVVVVGELMLNEGFGESVVQRRSLEPGHIDTAFWFLLAQSVAMRLLAMAVAPLAASVYGEPMVAWLIIALAPTLVIAAGLAIPMALLRRDLRFSLLAIRSTLAVALGGVAGVVAALSGFGVWSLVVHIYAMKLIDLAILLPSVSWRPGRRASWRYFRELRSIGFSNIGIRLASFLEMYLSRFLVGVIFGAASLGLFNLGLRLVDTTVNFLIGPFKRVVMPTAARLQDDRERVQTMLETGTHVVAAVTLPGFTGLALVAPDLVDLLLGDEWLGSVDVMRAYAACGPATALVAIYYAFLRGLGHPRGQLFLMLGGAAVLLVLILAIGRAGLVYVAAAVALHDWLILTAAALVFRRWTGLDVRPQLLGCLPLVVATVAMAAAVVVWREVVQPEAGSLVLLAGSVAVGVLVYGLACLIVARPLLRQILGLLRTIGKSAPAKSG